MNPEANLQLRQYPSSAAMSLGLLPNETELLVIGRRGPSEYYPGEPADEPVDLSDLTSDPAAGLYPVQDLPPADTWLNVVYFTPDGGSIYGWVNAMYLQVFDEDGDKQRLASLPTVRQNQAGSSANTALKPPDLTQRIAARVFRLDPAARLNIRMTAGADTEVLGQIAPGESVKFLGLNTAEDWAFITYASDDLVINGWVSAAYLQLLLNGEPVGIDTLRALDSTSVQILSDSVHGGSRKAADMPTPASDQAMVGVVGEVDLNFDAALHLRRNPDAQAKSLALIPAGAKLPLQGRTENRQWFRVAFDGEVGWAAAEYLVLSMDGQLYFRQYLEDRLPIYDDQGNLPAS